MSHWTTTPVSYVTVSLPAPGRFVLFSRDFQRLPSASFPSGEHWGLDNTFPQQSLGRFSFFGAKWPEVKGEKLLLLFVNNGDSPGHLHLVFQVWSLQPWRQDPVLSSDLLGCWFGLLCVYGWNTDVAVLSINFKRSSWDTEEVTVVRWLVRMLHLQQQWEEQGLGKDPILHKICFFTVQLSTRKL